MRRAIVATLIAGAILAAQNPEFEFYTGYREFMSTLWSKNPATTPTEILDAYVAKLKADGIADTEIARRRLALTTKRTELENDRWDRYYRDNSHGEDFNHQPNRFLMSWVADRRPGVALDYAMGNGRNAVYLAKLGWDTYGFDRSSAAVEIANAEAAKLGVKIHATAAVDTDYDFGKERFDLILFSWAMPQTDMKRIVASLKPGGIVLLEGAVDYVGHNGMLHLFDDLRIERYEIVKDKADWYGRREWEIIRMIARKP